jgi:hypothetical protein
LQQGEFLISDLIHRARLQARGGDQVPKVHASSALILNTAAAALAVLQVAGPATLSL